MPEARKLIATPAISWLPRKVIEASPWTSAKSSEARDPAPEARARPCPCRRPPRRRTRRRSASCLRARCRRCPRVPRKSPARQASSRGVASRRVRVEDLQQRCVIHHAASRLRPRKTAQIRTSSIRTILSSAPVNRITRPCTTVRSSMRDRWSTGPVPPRPGTGSRTAAPQGRRRSDGSAPSAPPRCR